MVEEEQVSKRKFVKSKEADGEYEDDDIEGRKSSAQKSRLWKGVEHPKSKGECDLREDQNRSVPWKEQRSKIREEDTRKR